MSPMDAVGERLSLAVRTTWLSEFTTFNGVLVMFEISHLYTSFGRLCAKLAEMPGVEFANHRPPARYAGPGRFRFKGGDYHVSIPHADYRIGPVDPEATYPEATEILTYVKKHIVRRPDALPRRVL